MPYALSLKKNTRRIVLANTWRLVATLFCGVVLGAICAGVMNWIKSDRVIGLFSGSSSERLLMLLATTLAAFALGHGEEGHELVPMGFAPGSTFQPELLVIVTGEKTRLNFTGISGVRCWMVVVRLFLFLLLRTTEPLDCFECATGH